MGRRLVLIGALGLFISGCATILHGSSQETILNVDPAGVEVNVYTLNGKRVAGPGVSPGALTIPRPAPGRQSYLVVATGDGSCPHYWLTSTSITPGGWVDLIVFNGVIPMAIDNYTGALFAVEPNPISGSLAAEDACGD